MEQHNKIFVTGLGSISALGYGADAAWQSILEGNSRISIKDNWQNTKIKPQFFGEAVDVAFEEEVKWDERFAPQLYSRLGILACKKALEDAQIVLESSDNEIGLIIETSLGATAAVEDYLYDLYQHGLAKVSPLKFTKTVANTVLGDISRTFKLNGPSSLIYNSNSISYGIDLIRKGVADIVICGGVDHYTEFRVLSEQENGRLISVSGDENRHQAIVDAAEQERNVLGDGAAFIVLESEESALKRGVRKYAEIVEYHSGFDYHHVEDTTRRSAHIIENAYTKFKPVIHPGEKVAYLSAYTTSRQLQHSEQPVLEKMEKENPAYRLCHKAYTGDMKAASSVMGASIASQILHGGLFPVKEASGSYPTGITYAFVSTAHEGGGSSHLIFKQTTL
ncbi:beta-ketoacyl synthase N-terminal-like domain-containing protein [Chitinophaga vietnamensis]|uniref:beta-ketoacyl synthase N-terminal-like domain-containing protein n=1 Tax=Chitinophaga vietnamensis TaxID=2593957 RepID=UPI001177F31B|nr:beta-ketoacyl synthase N-terminal-like domain-containing protein [Chitinophaga vietnamensis]